jgi:heme-degrading monooxygenase HmoA
MIVRLWRGRALPETADAYQRYVSTAVFPGLERLEGYLGGRVLRRQVDRYVEFLVVTEWTSVTAIRAFAGEPPDRAVVEPEARAVLIQYDTHVQHFELVQESPASGQSAP